MPRAIGTNILAAFAAKVVRPAFFVELDWNGTTQYMWSGLGNYTWGEGTGIYPISEWDFNAAVNPVIDVHGSDNLLAYNISWATVAGMGSSVVGQFNGSSTYAQGGADTALNFDGSTPFTLSLWLNMYALPSVLGVLISTIDGVPGSGAPGWEMSIDSSGHLGVQLINAYPSNWINVTTTNALNTGQTHHLVVTYDGSKTAAGLKIYIDGIAQSTTVVVDSLTGSTASSQPLTIGARQDISSYWFDGALSYIQVYNVALSSTDANTLFNDGPVTAKKDVGGTPITWSGIGQLGGVGGIEESTDPTALGVTLTLTGIDPTTLDNSISQLNHNAWAKIWLAFFDASGNMLDTPILSYAGLMDQPEITIGGSTASITLNLESRLADLQRAQNRKYTAQDQRMEYPNDSSMDAVERLIDTQLFWR